MTNETKRNDMKPTPEQIRAYINTVKAIADAIKDLHQVPAGTRVICWSGSGLPNETFTGRSGDPGPANHETI